MTFARSLVGVTLALLSAVTAYAQQQTRIPIRKVTTLAGSDSGVLANVYVLHAQSDGSVLVNDATRSRLLLFDATLKKYKLVADTAGESANNFGIGAGGLLLFAGDSTAFVDRASKALVIVDAKGNFGRVTTPPRVDDTGGFSGSTYGVPGFDAQGRLYYRGGLQVFTLPSQVGPSVIVIDPIDGDGAHNFFFNACYPKPIARFIKTPQKLRKLYGHLRLEE